MDCYKIVRNIKYLREKRRKMYTLSQIDNYLNKNVGYVISLLNEFSTSKLIDENESLPNPFVEYLIFTSKKDFQLGSEPELGSRKFSFHFKNITPVGISKMYLFEIVPSNDTLSGVKEIPLDIDFHVTMNKELILKNEKVPYQFLGKYFFDDLLELINQNKL